MLELVVATRNKGKVREITAALARVDINIVSLADYPCAPEVEEDGVTFRENAVKKARGAAEHTKMYALADDSGLEVDALDGVPGVHSARYTGVNATDGDNNNKLLAELEGVPDDKRAARFVCAIALCSPDGEVTVAEGVCEGVIAVSPRGTNGFGYDPLFYYPPLGKTFAELTKEDKLAVSHRGKALRALGDKVREIIAKERGAAPLGEQQ